MTDDVIAFVRVRGDSGQIFLVDPGSGEARALTDPDFDAHDPSWCPDGSQLVALGRGPGGSFIPQLHVIDVATGKTERITNDGAPKLRPAWSPDGLEIVFEMSIGETGYHLFTVHPDGRGLRRVTGPPMNQPLPPPPPTPLRPWVRVSTSLPQSEEMPAWSPDGSEIAFARSARVPPNGCSDRRRPGHHIWVVGREGGEERRLTEGAVHDLEPRLRSGRKHPGVHAIHGRRVHRHAARELFRQSASTPWPRTGPGSVSSRTSRPTTPVRVGLPTAGTWCAVGRGQARPTCTSSMPMARAVAS